VQWSGAATTRTVDGARSAVLASVWIAVAGRWSFGRRGLGEHPCLTMEKEQHAP